MNAVIDPKKYGVSFSLKQCRNFGIDPDDCLKWLLKKGWRRFRLMSYWDEHERSRGVYDFTALDEQIRHITNKSGIITLCLGVKQPRWPEYHWPSWTKDLSDREKSEALLQFVETVVERYKHEPAILSYQLENEALLKGFGRDIHIDRGRLRLEYELVRRLDPEKPVLMSTSNGWGVPLRRPLPWGVGFSLYTIMHNKGAYHRTIQRPWLHRLRAWYIRTVLGKPVFIHELQCEPWGPDAIWKMSTNEQSRSMSTEQIKHNIAWAKQIRAYPIDIWGAEWWSWRWQQGDHSIWQAVENALHA
ncbi:hypothetical protein JNM87_04545 [Candidatus Saccharibacteria bacterium]|nr:hypothetical protein [Candidatus Saccharibacteria bacterium]